MAALATSQAQGNDTPRKPLAVERGGLPLGVHGMFWVVGGAATRLCSGGMRCSVLLQLSGEGGVQRRLYPTYLVSVPGLHKPSGLEQQKLLSLVWTPAL